MRSGSTPSLMPNSGDVTVYIVEDDFERIGRAYRETDGEKADLGRAKADRPWMKPRA